MLAAGTVVAIASAVAGVGIAGAVGYAVLTTSGPFSQGGDEGQRPAAQATSSPTAAPTPTVTEPGSEVAVTTYAYLAGSRPSAVAVGPDGTVYMTDFEARRIYKSTRPGELTVFAGSGKEGLRDGPGATAEFMGPSGIAVRADGVVFVADALANRVRAISPSGEVTTFAGGGPAGFGVVGLKDGLREDAHFAGPAGLAFLPSGDLLVADKGNNALRILSPAGLVGTLVGQGTDGYRDGPVAQALLLQPVAVTVAADGTVYLTEHGNNAIRAISQGVVRTILKAVPGRDTRSGPSTTADGGLSYPSGIGVIADGSLVVSDTQAHRILRVTSGGKISVLAGQGGTHAFADGPGSQAAFWLPAQLAVHGSTVLIADSGNGRLRSLEVK